MHPILLIQDDPFWTKFCTIKFRESAKLKVISVKSAESAREYLRKDKPGAIIMDMILPGKDGFSFLEEIKTHDQLKKIPVVVLSGLGHQNDIKSCLHLGAVGYFNKHRLERFETLIETVKKYLA